MIRPLNPSQEHTKVPLRLVGTRFPVATTERLQHNVVAVIKHLGRIADDEVFHVDSDEFSDKLADAERGDLTGSHYGLVVAQRDDDVVGKDEAVDQGAQNGRPLWEKRRFSALFRL